MRTQVVRCISGLSAMLFLIAGLISAPVAKGEDKPATQPTVRKVAIFVKNREKKINDDRAPYLEDLVSHLLSDSGFSVISREDVLNAVSRFAKDGANVGEANGKGAQLDKILSDNTSAVALAQNLGAANVLISTIETFGSERIRYNGDQIKTDITEYRMRVGLKLLNIVDGGTETADFVTVSKKIRQTDQLQIDGDTEKNVVDDLMHDASIALTDSFRKKIEKGLPPPSSTPGFVDFMVVCGMADLTIPEVIKDEKGEYVVTANRYKLESLTANVSIDGIGVGTSGTALQSRPGIHKIRVSRPDFEDYADMINIVPNHPPYNIIMKMTPQGYAQWKERTSFLNDLKAGAKLDDAKAKAWEGFAKMLEQSGVRIDNKSTINATRPSDTNINVIK